MHELHRRPARPTALASLGRTVALAAAAAVVVTILAAVVVGLGGSARRRLGTALTLGYAVPGTALAIGVLVAYGPWLGGSAAIILSPTSASARPSGTGRWPPEPTGSPRSSARRPGPAAPTPATVFRTITAPAMSSGYVAAGGLVVLFACTS